MTNQNLPQQSQNPVRDPEDWVTGDEPMTGPAGLLSPVAPSAGRQRG